MPLFVYFKLIFILFLGSAFGNEFYKKCAIEKSFNGDKYLGCQITLNEDLYSLSISENECEKYCVNLLKGKSEAIDSCVFDLITKAFNLTKMTPPSHECHLHAVETDIKNLIKSEISASPTIVSNPKISRQTVIYLEDGELTYDYSGEGRSFGEKYKLIYENVNPNALPGGSYTFVILDTGDIIFGRVNNLYEHGVKHVMLADGRPVAIAGEMRVSRKPPKLIEYNLESGSFMRKMVEDKMSAEEDLKFKISNVFKRLGCRSKFVDEILLPRVEPTEVQKDELCADQSFCVKNLKICRSYQRESMCVFLGNGSKN